MAEAILVVTPTETIKTKLIQDQNQATPRFKNALHGTRLMFAESGIRGIYRGMGAVVARQGANSAVRMSSYSIIRDKLSKGSPLDRHGKAILPWYLILILGIIIL